MRQGMSINVSILTRSLNNTNNIKMKPLLKESDNILFKF